MKDLPDLMIELIRPSPPSFIDKAQMFFTGDPYSHAKLVFLGHTIEWVPGGMRMSDWEKYETSDVYRFHRNLTDVERAKATAWMSRWKHAPYNIPAFLMQMLVAPTRVFWEKIHWFPFSNPDIFGFYCYWSIASFCDYVVGDLWCDRKPTFTLARDFKASPFLIPWNGGDQ